MQITWRAARINANLTQEELADKMGLSRSTINDIETGKIEVKPYQLYSFCYIVGLDEQDIILPTKST